MNKVYPETLLAEFSERLAVQTGLFFPEKRFPDLERGIAGAAKEFGYADVESCLRKLLLKPLNKDQIKVLASYLTIGETYFFRDEKSFTFLETVILPELIRKRENSRQIRIWSAGCSSGEEPYSIAILLKRLLPRSDNRDISIIATDLNPSALARAEAGVYNGWAFRNMPESIRKEMFLKVGKNSWKIKEQVKSLVRFSYHNLMEDPFPPLIDETNAIDVILCRNVLMYFTQQSTLRIVSQFADVLTDGGWLIVSPVETSQVTDNRLTPVQTNGQIFFLKGHATPLPQVTEIQKPAPVPIVPAGVPFPNPFEASPDISRTKPVSRKKREIAPPPPLRPAPPDPAGLIEEGRFAEAIELLEKTLTENPDNSNDIILLVRAYANQGDLTRALEWCERGIESDPLNPVLHYLHAIILEESGDVLAGLEALRRTLYLDPDFILAHIASGSFAQRTGREKEAARHFTNARVLLSQLKDNEPIPESGGVTAGNLRKNLTHIEGAGT